MYDVSKQILDHIPMLIKQNIDFWVWRGQMKSVNEEYDVSYYFSEPNSSWKKNRIYYAEYPNSSRPSYYLVCYLVCCMNERAYNFRDLEHDNINIGRQDLPKRYVFSSGYGVHVINGIVGRIR